MPVFRVLYADARAKTEWQELMGPHPEECARAYDVMRLAPTKRSVRTVSLSGRLATVDFRGKRLPQWAHAITNEVQVRYLVDEEPDDKGAPITWLVGVAWVKFGGIDY